MFDCKVTFFSITKIHNCICVPHVVMLYETGELFIGGQEHFYMETQSIRVIPSKEGQEIDIYAATQDPTYMQVSQPNAKVITIVMSHTVFI